MFSFHVKFTLSFSNLVFLLVFRLVMFKYLLLTLVFSPEVVLYFSQIITTIV